MLFIFFSDKYTRMKEKESRNTAKIRFTKFVFLHQCCNIIEY